MTVIVHIIIIFQVDRQHSGKGIQPYSIGDSNKCYRSSLYWSQITLFMRLTSAVDYSLDIWRLCLLIPSPHSALGPSPTYPTSATPPCHLFLNIFFFHNAFLKSRTWTSPGTSSIAQILYIQWLPKYVPWGGIHLTIF